MESLRAIPWNFSWTQTRLNLPTWLGVGEALEEVLAGADADRLREMYRDWTAFSTTVDLVEMVLAKSEPSIAAHYDSVLVHDAKAQELGAHVRELHSRTEKAVLDLTGHTVLGEDNTVLQRALKVRNPYTDCLNTTEYRRVWEGFRGPACFRPGEAPTKPPRPRGFVRAEPQG